MRAASAYYEALLWINKVFYDWFKCEVQISIHLYEKRAYILLYALKYYRGLTLIVWSLLGPTDTIEILVSVNSSILSKYFLAFGCNSS